MTGRTGAAPGSGIPGPGERQAGTADPGGRAAAEGTGLAGGAELLAAVLPAPGTAWHPPLGTGSAAARHPAPPQRPGGAGGRAGWPALAAVEKFDDDFGSAPDAQLFSEEAATLTRAVDKRRREFTTGRICAHRALVALGVAAVPILSGDKREPLWPAGVVGSITHTAGYRAAAVARAGNGAVVSVGIDAEPNEPTPGAVLGEISLPVERAMLSRLGADHPAVSWDRLLFSAKESVYKAWFPLAGRWLGFGDAELTISVDEPGGAPAAGGPVARGAFQARLLVAGPRLRSGELAGFTGRWVVGRGLIVTAIAFAPPS